MSRNYNHSTRSRLSSNTRKKKGGKGFMLYLFFAVIALVILYLSRDFTPDQRIIEEDLTKAVKAGEFAR
jgi:hypothetical protein